MISFRKYLSSILVMCAFFPEAYCQDALHCGADALYTWRINTDPEYQVIEAHLEAGYVHHMRSRPPVRGAMHYELPVVVHVIHDDGPENIPDAQVHAALAWLNDAFRNEGYYNPATGVDTEISFCLATQDPDGNATTGINRVQSVLTNVNGIFGDDQVSNAISWDTRRFINIWVVRSICLWGDCWISGFAHMANASVHGTLFDGIVLRADRFGVSPVYNTTLVHEMGHYLGLHHPFHGGCKNNDCLTDGDRVCDTPPNAVSGGSYPCIPGLNSCTTDSDDLSASNPFRPVALGGLGDQPDMVENYMDYADGVCKDRFTEGQRDRMRYFIGQVRNSLLSSTACLPPCPAHVSADFSISALDVLAGEEITLTNMSANATGYQWYINGKPYSDAQDITPAFTEAGSYVITLEAYADDVSCRSDEFSVMVFVTCPVTAAFDYSLDATAVHLTDLSTGTVQIVWTIRTVEGDTIFISQDPAVSFGFPAPGRYTICLLAEGIHCHASDCRQIILYGAGFCDPDADDDGDGLIGLFDEDCPCDPAAFQAQCPIACQVLPDSFPPIEMRLKWMSEQIFFNTFKFSPNIVCGDFNDDGNTEVISTSSIGPLLNATNGIRAFSGIDGSLKYAHDLIPILPLNILSSASNIVLYRDLVLNNNYLLFFEQNELQVIKMDVSGSESWRSDPLVDFWPPPFVQYYAINIADFDNNGVPYVYFVNIIMNSQNGKVLAAGDQGRGVNIGTSASQHRVSHTIAADLLPSPGLELAAGNTVYIVEINNLSDTSGNAMIPVIADLPVLDGLTAVADIDGDGALDVIVVRSSQYPDGGGIWVWNPRTRGLIASGPSFPGGGIPYIGDVDGDCTPEIAVAFRDRMNVYKYTGTTDLDILYSIPIQDFSSGVIGITGFDLNNDGRLELIFRDERFLHIVDAATGYIHSRYPVYSGTDFENPIVADIDGDGHAEIVVNGSLTGDQETRIYAFESAKIPWAPARSVWNQTGYHVTNVNDDLSIPRVQQNMAAIIPGTEQCPRETCPRPYNAFMQQATLRTQQGCVQFPAVDLTIDVIDYSCTPDSMTFCVAITNLSEGVAIKDSICISCYLLDPLSPNGGWLVETNCFYFHLESLASDTVCMAGPIPSLTFGQMYFVVNDDGSSPIPLSFPVTSIPECDYSNNIDVIPIDIRPLAVDLGPDIIKCASEVVTFYADVEGAIAWLWHDGSTEPYFSTASPGTYFVEAYDRCGRAYRDTVLITLDTTSDIDLGDDLLICHGESVSISPDITTGWVRWFPAALVDCDTCTSVNVLTDTTAMLIAIAGSGLCISADTVLITVMQPEVSELSDAICPGESMLFFDTLLYDAGTYMHTTGACDSLYILTLDVNPADSVSMTLQICAGDSIEFDGIWLSNTGSYVFEYANTTGCDSVITVDLTVEDILTDTQSITLCDGDSVFVHDTWLSASGVYEAIVSTDPCLHILQTTISILPTYFKEENHMLCPGDSIWIDGVWYSSPDAFALYLQTAAGCDSTLAVTITVDEMYQKEEKYILCPGDSVQIDGAWYDVSAMLTFLHPAIDGCDTLYTVVIETVPSPPYPQQEIDCDTAAIILTLDTSGPWQAQWDHGETGSHAMYFNGTTAVLHLYADPGCVHIEQIALLPIPDIDALPLFDDITTTPGTPVVITSGLDPAAWTVTWSTPADLSCSHCATTELTTHHDASVEILMEHLSGCVFTAQFLVSVKDADGTSVYIPNVFTPNGDGINDTWMIFPADETLTFDEVLIFDRWGDLVAGWQNASIVSWDGTFRGKPLNPGVFVYVVRYTDRTSVQRLLIGDVTLLR